MNMDQFSPVVQSFQTTNPEGENSTYQRLPDNRWARDKAATGKTHIQDTTKFVHPSHASPLPHPQNKNVMYNPMEMAAATSTLVGNGGKISKYMAGDKAGQGSTVGIPDEHISDSPKEGWIPVEHSLSDDGSVSSYHLGHPVASFTKNNFRA